MIICDATLDVKQSTCSLIYLMNASLFHRPINWIVVTGMWARYIAIALPDRSEWHPISFTSNPSVLLPSSDAADRSFWRIWDDDTYDNLPFGVL